MPPQAEVKLVFPGDELAVAEEFAPGPGTYEEGGKVYAAWVGIPKLDPADFTATVAPLTRTPVTLHEGDEVVGRIEDTRSSMAIVRVEARVDAPYREIAGDTNGTLHISKVSDDYVSSMDDAFKRGDLVRAKVVSTDPSLQITTKEPHLGIVKSRCPRCATDMRAKDNTLVCPACEWKDMGKISDLYGTGKV
ncbi:MAG TPA: exosome complex RNA-binding protein Csl4 [Candidatus Thermoplasmatota archaeon]|jgi:exosome complex component CSL4|nr:exosome complex RNA-binding protein Csl4 [Candidatus Thermoplasmatota archaeon]